LLPKDAENVLQVYFLTALNAFFLLLHNKNCTMIHKWNDFNMNKEEKQN